MTFQFGQDLEMDQLRTNHNISKIFTTPSGKRGVVSTLRLESATTNQQVMTQKGGIADFSIVLEKLSYLLCNTSLNLRQARWRNILNTSSRLLPNFPDIDACLSNSTKFNKGGNQNG